MVSETAIDRMMSFLLTATVFEELLIDHETACNVGNWQWLSCSAFFSQFYRVYSPVAFGKKWDKTGALIREYVPELRDVPEKYIYEPWKMPKADQKAARIIIGGDGPGHYPKPIFDAQEQAKKSLAGMKASYAAKIFGNDSRVESGVARDAIESSNPEQGTDGQERVRKRAGEQRSIEGFMGGNRKKSRTDKRRESPAEEDENNEQMN